MTFRAIITKEVADLVREKRFGGWALAFLAFWSFILFMHITFSVSRAFDRRDFPESILNYPEPAFYFLVIALVILALFLLTDGVTKERESGMLPVVAATPAVRWHILLAKVVAGFVAYAAAFVIALIPIGVFAATVGMPAVSFLVQLFVGPFLALYVFLLGLGLLLSVAFSSSKVAIGVGAGVYFPLFLMGGEGPMYMLYRNYPTLAKLSGFTPFEAAYRGTLTIARGGVMPYAELAFTVFLGAALAGVAFWLFHRQEVAA